MNILNINSRHETNDYPYGRLRATAFFSVEFKKNKGFRHVFQTINPKNGRLNAVKNGTYNTFACNSLNAENGHFENISFNVHGFEDVNKLCKFLSTNKESLGELSKEMVTEICATLYNACRISLEYTSADSASLKNLVLEPMKTLIHGFKTGEIDFGSVSIDTDAIKALKDNYTGEPAVKFTITER